MFVFKEEFKVFDENYKPYGIFIESSSSHWHKGARIADKGYAISCCGNRYFLDVGKVKEFEATLNYGFSVLHDTASVSVVFAYDTDKHCGYELRLKWLLSCTLNVELMKIEDEWVDVIAVKTLEGVAFPKKNEEYTLKFIAKGNGIIVDFGDYSFDFDVILKEGVVGFSRMEYVGELYLYYAQIQFDKDISKQSSIKVEVPMYNGGTMPLTMEYQTFSCENKQYLRVTLDGGPQYRKNYKTYPLNTDQYVAERFL